MRTLLLSLVVVSSLGSACSAPSTTVRSIDTRPAIAVLDAAPNAVLVVDGRFIGPAANYGGNPNVLRLEPGTHEVEIRDVSGNTVYRQTIFVESEIKTIRVH